MLVINSWRWTIGSCPVKKNQPPFLDLRRSINSQRRINRSIIATVAKRQATIWLRDSQHESQWPDRYVNSTNCSVSLIYLDRPINALKRGCLPLSILPSGSFTCPLIAGRSTDLPALRANYRNDVNWIRADRITLSRLLHKWNSKVHRFYKTGHCIWNVVLREFQRFIKCSSEANIILLIKWMMLEIILRVT